DNQNIQTGDILDLIKSFSYTWFSLDRYDKNSFPKTGTKKKINITSEELSRSLANLKTELINREEASEMFAQEKKLGNLEGIIGNIFQAVFGQDVYKTIEEKAAHLLYFIIKNHPFNDGNKRSGAFTFIWFLNKARFNFRDRINPESLATLTILIAESSPKDKEKMIGIILLLLDFK
ncbi:MAG: Fic family protein, partial [Candidatus Caldatribacteriota bacterium]